MELRFHKICIEKQGHLRKEDCKPEAVIVYHLAWKEVSGFKGDDRFIDHR